MILSKRDFLIKMQMRLAYIVLFFLYVGCAGSQYYLEVSPRHQILGADFFESSTYSDYNGGSPIDHTAFKVYESGLAGTGGQISLVEVNGFMYSRLGYHFNRLKSDTFSYTIEDSIPTPTSVDLDINGFEAELGFKLWHFMPHISAIYSDLSFSRPELNVVIPDKNFFFPDYVSNIAFGLAVEIPLSKRFNILLNSNFSKDNQIYSLGLLVGGWQPVPPSKEKPERRKTKR